MSRPVYSTSFVLAELEPADPPLGFIPDVDQVVVVRDMELRSTAGLPGDELAFYIQPGSIPLLTYTVGTQSQFQWQGRIVIPYGFSFEFVSFTGTWAIACSGYLLTNP
jgi:hypothetical protein